MTAPDEPTSAFLDMIDRCVSEAERGKGSSDQQVRALERSLGVALPADYVAFLKRFGWLETAETTVFGISIDSYLDVVKVAEWERTQADPPMPRGLVPVMNDGAGNHFCLDRRERSQRIGSVVFWDHEGPADQDPAHVADTFATWLSDRIRSTPPDV